MRIPRIDFVRPAASALGLFLIMFPTTAPAQEMVAQLNTEQGIMITVEPAQPQPGSREPEIEVDVVSRPDSITLKWPDRETRPRVYRVERRVGQDDVEGWQTVCAVRLRSRSAEAVASRNQRFCRDNRVQAGGTYTYRLGKWVFPRGVTQGARVPPPDGTPDAAEVITAKAEAPDNTAESNVTQVITGTFTTATMDRNRAEGARTRDHRGGRDRRSMCVRNVRRTFKTLPARVKKRQYLGARNRVIPAPRYTSNIANSQFQKDLKFFNYGSEHFQGIQRKGRYLFLSGGMKYAEPQKAQLIIVQMGSRPADGPWSIPEYPSSHKNPDPADQIVKVVDLDQRLWHAGGIQRDGNVLAVGLFGGGASQVRFYDISQPTRPTEIRGARLGRRAKSYAAGLTTLPDGRRLLVAWDDKHLDFYLSRSTDLADGFESDFQRVHKRDVQGGVTPGGCTDDDVVGWLEGQIGPCGTFQNLNLVTECDGDTYLLGFRNENKNILGKGGDFVGLYAVRWPGGYGAKPEVRLLERKHMYCYGPCNFGGGAGIYRTAGTFFIYGVAPYLHGGNDRVNFNEYAMRVARGARRRGSETRSERNERNRGEAGSGGATIRDHRDN